MPNEKLQQAIETAGAWARASVSQGIQRSIDPNYILTLIDAIPSPTDAERNERAKIYADINDCSEGWVQVTLSGDGAEHLTEAEIEALFSPPPSAAVQETRAATHRHKKRGSEYALIGIGRMQAENWRELIGEQYLVEGEEVGAPVDMREVSIYRASDDGSLWVRPREEFEDGRFETIRSALSSPVGGVDDEIDKCPVCAEPFKADDTCATDIELGTCHAACLEGSPTVDLETGEQIDGPIPTYHYGDVYPAPAPEIAALRAEIERLRQLRNAAECVIIAQHDERLGTAIERLDTALNEIQDGCAAVAPRQEEAAEEMITIDGTEYRKFIRYPEGITDGTLRCISCGQIDEPEYHDDNICPHIPSMEGK